MFSEMKQQVVLEANDMRRFLVEPGIFKSKLVDNLIEILPEDSRTQAIPLPDIGSHTLEMIIKWCQERSHLERGVPPSELAEWNRASLPRDEQQVIEVIIAANYLEIEELTEVSAQNLASMCKDGEIISQEFFEHVRKLPQEIQNRIIQYIPPLALKKASNQKIVNLTLDQKIHNHFWTSIMKKDNWCEAAMDLGANPILIGADLEKKAHELRKRIKTTSMSASETQKQIAENGHVYLVLSSMDWEGDLKNACCDIRDYLQNFTFDTSTSECRMKGSNITLNIWEAHHAHDVSEVVDVDNKLVSWSTDVVRTTSVLYLKSPILRRLHARQPPVGRVTVLCTDCVYFGKIQTWVCTEKRTNYQKDIPFGGEL
jgi:S-phase kinase-associated protein 1